MDNKKKLQFIYLSRGAIERIISESSQLKRIWTSKEDIEYWENAISFLTTDRMELYHFRRGFEPNLYLSYSSGMSEPRVVSYSAVQNLYSWTANTSNFNDFENGWRAVMIGLDLSEKERIRLEIANSRLSIDNLVELHFTQGIYLSKMYLPTGLTEIEQERLIHEFEDYRRTIRQREMLADIQNRHGVTEIKNAYNTPWEYTLDRIAERQQELLFSQVRFHLSPFNGWSEPQIEMDTNSKNLIVCFRKKSNA